MADDGNYVTIDEIKRIPNIILDPYTDEDIADIISRMEEWIETICNDRFYSFASTYYFDGSGTISLFFFKNKVPYRLISASSVQEVQADGTVDDTYVENTDFIIRDYLLEVYEDWSDDKRRNKYGSAWPHGQQNIKIVGTWGRSTTPEPIKRAAKLLVAEEIHPGIMNMAAPGIKSESYVDRRVTYVEQSFSINMTGYPEVDRLLKRYVNTIGMISAQ